MASSSSSIVTLAGFSGSHLTTIRPFLPPNSESKITPLDVETPLSPSYGGLPTNVKTYPFPVLLTIPSDIETDVERLAEVSFLLECLCIPRSRAIQIRDVNSGAEC